MGRRRMVKVQPSPRQIGEALRTAREARSALLAAEPDAFEQLDRVMEIALDAEAMVEAIESRIVRLDARMERLKHRRETMRFAALRMMEELGLDGVERPTYSLSVGPSQRHVVVVDAERLADEYVRTRREPDKAAIRAALLDGREVDGAALSNAQPVLRVKAS